MSDTGKFVCKACGGELTRLDKFPTRPGIEAHKFQCVDCRAERRIEVDTRFG
jgi:hypothetical protein